LSNEPLLYDCRFGGIHENLSVILRRVGQKFHWTRRAHGGTHILTDGVLSNRGAPCETHPLPRGWAGCVLRAVQARCAMDRSGTCLGEARNDRRPVRQDARSSEDSRRKRNMCGVLFGLVHASSFCGLTERQGKIVKPSDGLIYPTCIFWPS